MNRTAASSPVAAAFDRRAARAHLLAQVEGPARAPLRFASALLTSQARTAEGVERLHRERPLSGRLVEDAGRLLRLAAALFEQVASSGPDSVADEAAGRCEEEPDAAEARLLVYWSGDRDVRGDYLSRALLRPYAEVLASLVIPPDRAHLPGHCPFCGGRPLISARRELPEATGAQRVLGCGLCGSEWPFNRILCASCGNDDPDRLPSFKDERHPLVRIEACETCHRYVKSIDLTLDARPVPEVDDLLSVSLDLWAQEQGYERIEPGLAGV